MLLLLLIFSGQICLLLSEFGWLEHLHCLAAAVAAVAAAAAAEAVVAVAVAAVSVSYPVFGIAKEGPLSFGLC